MIITHTYLVFTAQLAASSKEFTLLEVFPYLKEYKFTLLYYGFPMNLNVRDHINTRIAMKYLINAHNIDIFCLLSTISSLLQRIYSARGFTLPKEYKFTLLY